ncbi:hypothetical protein TWF696_002031 [Orbilia brochopaga]|uniref:Uncharacterized protein n=1 Tax=Orbilia brochopaga TaxID=3140254 RepID=A0AAV9U7B3_9PEZI
MHFHLFTLITSLLLLLTTPLLATPVNITDTDLIGPRNLYKRDTIDCKGSGLCGFLNGNHCRKAAQEGFADSVTYFSETRRIVIQNDLFRTFCLAMYKCENPDDYQYGMPGSEIRQRFRNIKDLGGCEKCGTNWYFGSCRVTFNYCSGSGCKTA